MSKNVYATKDFNGLELQNTRLHQVADASMAATLADAGDYAWNTDNAYINYYDGAALQTIASQSYVDSQINSQLEGLAWKDEVVAATTAEITIASDLNVGDSIDGVTLVDGDRVLVKDQTTNPEENGIYIVGVTPVRAADMNASAEFNSAVVPVQAGGTANSNTTWRCIVTDPVVDTTDIIFSQFGADVPDASTTVKGIVELATTAETEAKTDTTRAVTPSGLATFTRKYTETINTVNNVAYTVTHSLNTTDVIVQLKGESGNLAEIEVSNYLANSVDLIARGGDRTGLRVIIVG